MSNIPEMMKACVLTAYNKLDVVSLPVPKPGPREVLCRIKAVAICGSDPKVVWGDYANVNWPPYFPFVMGHEWSGKVVALGEGVTEFKIGDRVAGEAHKGCGGCENCKRGRYAICLNYGQDGKSGRADKGHRHYGFYWQGANAEYGAFSINSITHIPENVSYEIAAMCDSAGIAMHAIELIGITPAGTAVVFGPGPIGLCAMQIAKGMGAGRIVMVGRGEKLNLSKELGADVIINFEYENPVERILEITGGIGCDEVIECSGAYDVPAKAVLCLKKGGQMSIAANYADESKVDAIPLNKVVFNEITIKGSKANPNVSKKVLEYFSSGVINGEKMVTHTFPLEKYKDALDTFTSKAPGVVKVVVKP